MTIQAHRDAVQTGKSILSLRHDYGNSGICLSACLRLTLRLSQMAAVGVADHRVRDWPHALHQTCCLTLPFPALLTESLQRILCRIVQVQDKRVIVALIVDGWLQRAEPFHGCLCLR